MKNAKKVSYGVSCEFSDHSFYGADSSTLADITFSAEKAKAKRAATKSAQGETKDQSGKSKSAATCPIAYLSYEYFGNTVALPGKLIVGQLYWKLLSSGEDLDCLRLTIRYGLPSGKQVSNKIATFSK